MTDTRRRVKLYALNADRQWDDRGTGHVSSSYVDRLKGISLLVRAESDGSVLLESRIQPDTAYQKQQVTVHLKNCIDFHIFLCYISTCQDSMIHAKVNITIFQRVTLGHL